jgi:hypothetical protein
MDLREIEWGGVEWIPLAQGRDKWRALVDMVMNLRVPLKEGNFLEFLSYLQRLQKILGLRIA